MIPEILFWSLVCTLIAIYVFNKILDVLNYNIEQQKEKLNKEYDRSVLYNQKVKDFIESGGKTIDGRYIIKDLRYTTKNGIPTYSIEMYDGTIFSSMDINVVVRSSVDFVYDYRNEEFNIDNSFESEMNQLGIKIIED